MKKQFFALLLTSSLCLAAPAFAEETALTIYSKAQPGAIDPNLYRPVNGQAGYNGMNVPGYAVVRELRDHRLERPSRARRRDLRTGQPSGQVPARPRQRGRAGHGQLQQRHRLAPARVSLRPAI